MNTIDNNNIYPEIQASLSAPLPPPQPTSNETAPEAPTVSVRQDMYIRQQPAVNTPEGGRMVERPADRELKQPRDEFYQTPIPVHDAVYNVYDVRRDRHGQVRRSSTPQANLMSDRRESEKIADILLAMGRKGLAIFRMSDQAEHKTVRRMI